jgi:hypothetical protein
MNQPGRRPDAKENVEEAVAFLRDLCASVVKMPFGLSVPDGIPSIVAG